MSTTGLKFQNALVTLSAGSQGVWSSQYLFQNQAKTSDVKSSGLCCSVLKHHLGFQVHLLRVVALVAKKLVVWEPVQLLQSSVPSRHDKG